MNKRQNEIVKMVNDAEMLSVVELARTFKVSQATIRMDLTLLERESLLRRIHGGAIRLAEDDVARHMMVNFDVKRAIAKAAAGLIKDGEQVMIESGSVCALLASELVFRKNITIITNSTFIARNLRFQSSTEVVLIGGNYQKASEVTVGPLTSLCLNEFHTDKLFAGLDGFTYEQSFSGSDMLRVDVVRGMARNANKVILLTDSSKFGHFGVTRLFQPQDVHRVITDDGIPAEYRSFLEKEGVAVDCVSLSAEQ